MNITRTCLQIYFDYKLGGTSKGVTARNRVYCIRTIEGSSPAVKVELISLMTEVQFPQRTPFETQVPRVQYPGISTSECHPHKDFQK